MSDMFSYNDDYVQHRLLNIQQNIQRLKTDQILGFLQSLLAILSPNLLSEIFSIGIQHCQNLTPKHMLLINNELHRINDITDDSKVEDINQNALQILQYKEHMLPGISDIIFVEIQSNPNISNLPSKSRISILTLSMPDNTSVTNTIESFLHLKHQSFHKIPSEFRKEIIINLQHQQIVQYRVDCILQEISLQNMPTKNFKWPAKYANEKTIYNVQIADNVLFQNSPIFISSNANKRNTFNSNFNSNLNSNIINESCSQLMNGKELIICGYREMLNNFKKSSKSNSMSTWEAQNIWNEYFRNIYFNGNLANMGNTSASNCFPIASYLYFFFISNQIHLNIKSILDVGCYYGKLLQSLTYAFRSELKYVYGIEQLSEPLMSIRKEIEDILRLNGKLEDSEILQDEYFCKEVHYTLNHITFQEFCQQLKDGAYNQVFNDSSVWNSCNIDGNDDYHCMRMQCECHCRRFDNGPIFDLSVMFDVAQYMSDIDLSVCLERLAKHSWYLYFVVPTKSEHRKMRDSDVDKFDDYRAIHRSQKEYQEMLCGDGGCWRLVGNGVWESKYLCKQTWIQNKISHIG